MSQSGGDEPDAARPAETPSPATPPAAPESLMATTVRGIRLAGIGYFASQALNLLAYLAIVRLLTPRAYGVYAAGTLVTGIGGLFAESGMLAALIKREDRLEEAASTAFAALMVSGLLLALGSLAISPLLGLAFHNDEVTQVTAVLSGWLFIRALMIVPDALLQRRFSFLRRMVVDPLGVVAYAAAGIPLAAAGAGVWALVAGSYVSIIAEALASWISSGFRPRRELMSVAMWRELASFTRPLVIGEVLRRVMTQIDVFMLGRFTNAPTLGQYRNGQMLSSQPGGLVSVVASYVILPAFARLSVVPERVSAAARHAFWAAYTLIFPVSLALLPLGVPLAVTLLGDRWRPAGHAISALAGMVLGYMLMSLAAELMKATGQIHFQLRIQVLGLALMAATVTPAAIIWGLVAVSLAVSLTALVTVVCAMVGIAHRLGFPARGWLRGAAQPVAAALAMDGVMLWFQHAVGLVNQPEGTRVALLAAELAIGAIVYCAALAAIDPARRHTALAALRRRGLTLGR